MVDTDAAANGSSVHDYLSDKDDNCGYASGRRKSDDGSLSCGYSSFIGKRLSMEDFYDIKASEVAGQPVWMFGIFDGHGGARAASFLKGNLFNNLLEHPEFISNTKLAISYILRHVSTWAGSFTGETYQQTDIDFLESEKDTFRDDGSTASAAVLVGNHLYVANVGDSRTIVSKSGIAIPLSDDHKPNRSDERRRIESAGGRISWAGTWRVGGILAMSRAFGNRMLKKFVVAEPEIQDMEIDEDLDFIVLATDGLWDVVPNEDAVSIVRSEEDPETAARKLTEAAFSHGSADNITCIVVKFHHDMNPNPDDHHMELDLENHYMETDSENLLHIKSDPEKNDHVKADSDNDPLKNADPEIDPLTKVDPEIHPMKNSDPENDPNKKSDPEIHAMKSDPEKNNPTKADPDNDPLKKSDPESHATKADPEIHATKADPEIHATKADPEIYPMKADPENDPVMSEHEIHAIKADPEIHPMKADPKNILVDPENVPTKASPEYSCGG